MSEKNTPGGSSKSFAQYLKDLPASADEPQRMQVTGVVRRGEKEGAFVLRTADGQSLELEASMVERYAVVQEAATERVVQLELKLDKLAKPVLDRLKSVVHDTLKEGAYDTLKEGAYDTLAWSDTSPIADRLTLAWSDTSPLADHHTGGWHDTSPLLDQGGTTPIGDVKLGAYDTLEEGIGGGIDPTVNPASGGTPFVLATPHHAPTAEAMMRAIGGSAAAGLAPGPKPVLSDAHTIIKEPISDPQTFKEVITDPIADYKTIKELTHDPITIWEGIGGGGTLREGIGTGFGGAVQPPVWGLPGMMF